MEIIFLCVKSPMISQTAATKMWEKKGHDM